MGLTRNAERVIFFSLTAISVVLYALYFVHLRADYPALLPAVDWARYTDEGWYGGAALHHAQGEGWFVPNGFNPAVALPVWPLLLRGWFALTGAGMVAARVLAVLLFGGTNLLLFVLLRPLTGRVLAVAAVLLMLADPFCYGFNRMAILEPLVSFLFMLSLCIAKPRSISMQEEVVDSTAKLQHSAPWKNLQFSRSALTGLLLTALVLTKTTAVLLAPAVLYLLWQYARTHRHDAPETARSSFAAALQRMARDRRAFWPLAVASAVALLTWSAYFLLLVRPHHLADYQHLFTVNAGKAHGRILLQVMARAVGDATWMGGLLWALTLLVLAASLRYLRELWRIPLFGAAVLALVLPIAFIGWHTWFIPHYYLPCVAPMLLVLAPGLHALARRAHAPAAPRAMQFAHTAAMLAVEVALTGMLVQTLGTALHPRYTYWQAAQNIASRMHAYSGAGAEPRLLASTADDLSLFTGIRSVNPEWPIGGTGALLANQHPGWYGAFLPWDAKRLADMQRRLPLQEVARYTIQPDPDHQVFVLYRVAR